jgi:hypothetical protein
MLITNKKGMEACENIKAKFMENIRSKKKQDKEKQGGYKISQIRYAIQARNGAKYYKH